MKDLGCRVARPLSGTFWLGGSAVIANAGEKAIIVYVLNSIVLMFQLVEIVLYVFPL